MMLKVPIRKDSYEKSASTALDNSKKNIHKAEAINMTSNKKRGLEDIREALDTLNQHKFVRLYNSTFKLLWLQFLKGIAFGLGSVLGATIVVSLLISILAQIVFIPIVCVWAIDLMLEIQQSTISSSSIQNNECNVSS